MGIYYTRKTEIHVFLLVQMTMMMMIGYTVNDYYDHDKDKDKDKDRHNKKKPIGL